MGRGIYYNHNAVVTIHIDSSEWCEEEDQEFFGPEIWRETMDTLLEAIEKRWPSFSKCDRWVGREEHAMMENYHAELVVYEYCGMTSIALVPRDDAESPELATHWCEQIATGLQAMCDKLFPGKTLDRTSGYTTRVREVA